MRSQPPRTHSLDADPLGVDPPLMRLNAQLWRRRQQEEYSRQAAGRIFFSQTETIDQ
jgi:hypothetical protein